MAMPYKTILVHLNDRRRAGHLLKPAIALAARWGAHLIGLHAYPSIPQLSAFGTRLGGEAVGSIVGAARQDSEHIHAVFERMTANQPFVAEWLEIKAMGADIAELVMERGRAADLIVTSQADPAWDLAPILDFPERLAVESGRPVLVVPNEGHFDRIGRSVMVAWSGTREASRAVFDALPFLQRASIVTLLSIKRNSHRGEERVIEGADIAATLSRHGVKCEVAVSVAADISIEDDLLSRASDYSADLIVMGCYGHSRLREFIMGGTTRGILAHMTVPVLMSH